MIKRMKIKGELLSKIEQFNKQCDPKYEMILAGPFTSFTNYIETVIIKKKGMFLDRKVMFIGELIYYWNIIESYSQVDEKTQTELGELWQKIIEEDVVILED